MKLTKKQEKEIWQVYDAWLNSYLNGDVETYNSFLDDEYHFIGSATKEEFLNRKDTTEFFAETGDQFAGKTEIRNESKFIEQFCDLIFITHVLDGWFLHEKEWNFYSRFRFSSILRKNKDGWRFIYQHFSIPDPKTAEGETIGYDKINEENQELREAIQRRTIELEQKNRELKIEGALERIRAQAVAMKTSSDLLDIVVTMRNEFIKLGHEAHYFWHMMWLPETYEKAMTSGDGSKIGFVMKLPRHIHGDIPLLANWEKSKTPTVVYPMNTEEAIAYVDKMVALGDFQNIDPQAPSHDDIRHIGGLTFIMARTTHGEIGYSLQGIIENPHKEDIDILVKFAGAFDLAHRRFLDLQKAEKQARETQIELALEKIRSRSMAMHKSDELKEVIQVVYDQFVQLQVTIDHAGFILDYKENEDMQIWLADHNAVFPKIVLPYFDCAHWNNFIEAKKTGGNFFTNQLDFEEKNKFYKDLFQFIPDLPEETKTTYFGFEGLAISTVLLDTVGLYIENYNGNPFSDEENAILMRFGKVFQQAFTRFLDLQKAEAQAREAKIEAALERTRTQSMLMQHADEIKSISNVFHEQLLSLDIPTEFSYVWLPDESTNSHQFWASWSENKKGKTTLKNKQVTYPLDKSEPYTAACFAAWANPDVIPEVFIPPSDIVGFFDVWQELLQGAQKLKAKFFPQGIYYSEAYMRYGCFGINIRRTLSDEEKNILKRFSIEFERAYTRFLDLKKAEAQAREAQIETALEKIRSRTMAMQKGEELQEVAVLLYKELIALGVTNFVTCGYVEVNEEIQRQHTWVTSPGGDTLGLFHLPLTGDETFDERYAAWKNQQTVFHQSVAGQIRSNHLEYAITTFNSKEAEEMVRSQFPDPTVFYCFNFSHGYLHLVTGSLLKKEEELLLARFTKIFEQTYTRFLDLQKAEAQAKEAQIEAALERVRSQSMGMQSSTDFSAVTTEMFNQLRRFDGDLFATGIVFCDKHEGHVEQWHSIPGAGMMTPFIVPVDLDYIHQYRYDEWKKGTELFSVEIPEHFIKEHFDAIFNLPSAQKVLKDLESNNTPMPEAPAWEIDYGASFKNGYILVSALQPFESLEILPRFAKVFEQAYTRFLDLKNAEAQTREAQINLAVERVRAKALAMHKSEEILEVVAKLKDEVMGLDIPDVVASTIFLNEEDDKVRMWDLSSLELDDNYSEVPFDITFKLKKSDPHLYVKRVWENPENYFVELQDEKDFKRLMVWLREQHKNEIADEVEDHIEKAQLKRLHHAVKKLNNGKLVIDLLNPPSDEMETILTKMGAAFDLAYKRFEDLKKAEAQAQEAKIEAALEKVRSVALSLKNSDDMLEIAQVLYEQLLELGFTDIRNAIIDIHNDNNETFLDYDYSHDMSSAVTEFSFYGDPVIEQQIKKVQSSNDAFFEIELKGKELEELIETRLRNGEKDDPRLHKTDHLTYNLYSFGNGAIGISNFGILSDTQKKVLKRFRNVFTFAYKRYTDLANAEAQAMEAKIEASLERVRSVALGLNKSDDMLEVAQALYEQLLALGFTNIRNSIIDIDNGDGLTFSDFDYSHEMGGTVTQMSYKDDPTLKEQLEDIIATTDGFSELALEGQQLQDLIDMRRNNGEKDDPRLLKTDSVSYILYAFGKGAIGISNFGVLPEHQKSILSRFRNVFTFAYQRYTDLAQSEAQAAALLAEKQRLEVTLSDLQATQSQLIQSEKMASLGELTAGIAHEIQNPLNFVNNFSEVSNELIDEIDEELTKGDMEEVKALLTNIKQNLIKINHHGKRADGIVKGMLQHSRSSSATKEPTDINALCDEYLRLSYHGLRAKDKSFNATLKTDFEDKLKKINVIPQDLGRVVLNLLTNAFYVVNEKKQQNPSGYEPTVTLITKTEGKNLEIKVTDNGNGMPQEVVDKIFQPFFTTKPTGQGTGLGLSMSYDIITKGHGGELKVDTKQGQGTIFSILLPI
ncbi:ATP-binding protein [Planktosalinus lacus]|uniref:histidine kinase n=1 Tax=Planktosalinus lacus TaxID=1526573 RepID=A0A8J2Y8D2_9FLAO|nr:ATP-binding protein [Planktosalinus lacus]GGE01387.1 hypothetical protein GCM10011312_26040 [Planktosalinus lacus]